jgi:hypothetical protein
MGRVGISGLGGKGSTGMGVPEGKRGVITCAWAALPARRDPHRRAIPTELTVETRKVGFMEPFLAKVLG